MAQFRKQGIQLLTSHKLTRFGKSGDVKFMEAECEGETVRVEFDQVLLGILAQDPCGHVVLIEGSTRAWDTAVVRTRPVSHTGAALDPPSRHKSCDP